MSIENIDDVRRLFQFYSDYWQSRMVKLIVLLCVEATMLSIVGLFLFLLTINDSTTAIGMAANLTIFMLLAWDFGKIIPLCIQACQSYALWSWVVKNHLCRLEDVLRLISVSDIELAS